MILYSLIEVHTHLLDLVKTSTLYHMIWDSSPLAPQYSLALVSVISSAREVGLGGAGGNNVSIVFSCTPAIYQGLIMHN